MSGIVFMKTCSLEKLRSFYTNKIKCSIWLDQGDCIILRHGNFLFGFCDRKTPDICGMLTFFYPEKSDVDDIYETFRTDDLPPPAENKKYNIYHFFTKDPEGRILEFQYFNSPVPEI